MAEPHPTYSWNGQKKLERINQRFQGNDQKTSGRPAQTPPSVLARVSQSSQHVASSVLSWTHSYLDQFLPPERRAELLENTKTFANANPKLSAFIGVNLIFAGIPIVVFVVLSLGLLVFSSVVGVVLGLLAAVCFTFFCIGLALLVFLPTVTFAITVACSLFIWGIVGLYTFQWVSSARNGRASSGRVTGLQGDVNSNHAPSDSLDVQKPYQGRNGSQSISAQENAESTH